MTKGGLCIPVKKVRNPSHVGPLMSKMSAVEAEEFFSLPGGQPLKTSRVQTIFQGILFVTPSLSWKFIMRFEIMSFSALSCLRVLIISPATWLRVQPQEVKKEGFLYNVINRKQNTKQTGPSAVWPHCYKKRNQIPHTVAQIKVNRRWKTLMLYQLSAQKTVKTVVRH